MSKADATDWLRKQSAQALLWRLDYSGVTARFAWRAFLYRMPSCFW
jgi:hypothetical protein